MPNYKLTDNNNSDMLVRVSLINGQAHLEVSVPEPNTECVWNTVVVLNSNGTLTRKRLPLMLRRFGLYNGLLTVYLDALRG